MDRKRKSCSFSSPKLDQSWQKSSANTNNNRSSNKLQLEDENLDQWGELKMKDQNSSLAVDATKTFFNRISTANSQLSANLKRGKQSLMNQYQKIADKKLKKDLLAQKLHQGGSQTKQSELMNRENIFHFHSGTKSMPEKLKFSKSTNKEVSKVEKKLKLPTFSKTEWRSALKHSQRASTHTGNSTDSPALYRECTMVTNTRNDTALDQFMKSNEKPISYSLQRFLHESSVVNDDLEDSHLKIENNPKEKFHTNKSVLTNVLRENQGNIILESNDIPSTSGIAQSVFGNKQNIEDTDAPKMFKPNQQPQSTTNSINLNQICSESNYLIKNLNIESEEIAHMAVVDDREQNTHKVSRSLDEFKDNSLHLSKTLSTGSKQTFSPIKKRLRTALNEITLNKELYYKGAVVDYTPMQTVNCTFRNHVERIFFNMLLRAVNNEPLVIIVRNMRDWTNCVFEDNMLKMKDCSESKFTSISYNVDQSRSKFSIICYLLGKMYSLLSSGSVCSQREIYYSNKKYLGSQRQISAALNTISCMLDIGPWYFPILPSTKGMVYGPMTLIIDDNVVINCGIHGGTAIPQNVITIRKIISKASFLMIVEKDTIFKKLMDKDIGKKITRPLIIITGKGFPDVNTKLFVRIIRRHLKIPVFILVDADPYGIEIMLSYKYGSLNMSHLSKDLAEPKIKWLGVLPSEIIPLAIQPLILTATDKNKIISILKRPYIQENDRIKEELNILLENNIKSEIEGVIKSDDYLTDFYLPNKLCNRAFF